MDTEAKIRESSNLMKQIHEEEHDILINALVSIVLFNSHAKKILESETVDQNERGYLKEFVENSDELITMWHNNVHKLNKQIEIARSNRCYTAQ